jgi:hypothetical protein
MPRSQDDMKLANSMKCLVFALGALVGAASPASAQAPLTKLGEIELAIHGLQVAVEPERPVVPKNISSGVRIVVRAGGRVLDIEEARRLLGDDFAVQGDVSGPGLSGTRSLPDAALGDTAGDRFLLRLPPFDRAGEHQLANLRIVATGRPTLDVTPSAITIDVIDQILVTSVQARSLTLDEIRAKGIVLGPDAYLGFEFTIGMKLESQPINFSIPVVFDRQGVPTPDVLKPPPAPTRDGIAGPASVPPPTFVPMLLEGIGPDGKEVPLTLPGYSGGTVKIPSLLMIPGNVGYLKQHFSAQLFVANGAPAGSGLFVRDVKGKIKLPLGNVLVLPQIAQDGVATNQPLEKLVRALGPDGEPGTADDVARLAPGEQGQAEFLIRGEQEGFHELAFDINAMLEGLPVGPVRITGNAKGGVLVRNARFALNFTAPATVRNGEKFSLYATVTNIGQGIGNDVSLSLFGGVAGAVLNSEPTQQIDSLQPGDSTTFKFDLTSRATGKVVASYLRFNTEDGHTGDLRFTLGVGERGVPLSPDTLVLPAAVDTLPTDVVSAAMRVLGQAWSVALAPAGTLPATVTRTTRSVVSEKALALSEAGLRAHLRKRTPEAVRDAVRDVLIDFYGGKYDEGFDQILRQTAAGRDLATAIGKALAPEADAEQGLGFERTLADVAGSERDVVTFSVAADNVQVRLLDPQRKTLAEPGLDEPQTLEGAAMVRLGSGESDPVVGYLGRAIAGSYVLTLDTVAGGMANVSVTLPAGGGRFVRGWQTGVNLPPSTHAEIVLDLSRPSTLSIGIDSDHDGIFEERKPLVVEDLEPAAPEALTAVVLGPETLNAASYTGVHGAIVFDRPVGAASAAGVANYAMPKNEIYSASRQLSGRIVFVSFRQPENPDYVAAQVSVTGMQNSRGATAGSQTLDLASFLLTPGAVVSGRIRDADGRPVTGSQVIYWYADACSETPITFPVAAVSLDGAGEFEFRYVRQDPCGAPFELYTTDPATGARRSVQRSVRNAGERIWVDFVHTGRGSVRGVVKRRDLTPVAGANVTVRSVADSQSGAATVTGPNGEYRVTGITVGAVTVQVAKGTGVGRGAGTIMNTTEDAVVDVTLDDEAGNVSGVVTRTETIGTQTTTTAAVGVPVRYTSSGILLGLSTTDAAGRYAFERMPAGNFVVSATLYEGLSATSGVQSMGGGSNLTVNLAIVVPPASQYATVSGTVHLAPLADGTKPPVPGAVVTIGNRGVATDQNGFYRITGVEVRAGQQQAISARTSNRSGSASVVVNGPQEYANNNIQLSGLGDAEFLVLDSGGRPVAGETVRLLGCSDACGCTESTTDANGRARFLNGSPGSVSAKVVLLDSNPVDVASASVVVPDGGTGYGVIRMNGTGRVEGRVMPPVGGGIQDISGIDVWMSSLRWQHRSTQECHLAAEETHRTRTDNTGRFVFNNVLAGPVTVAANHFEFPTVVSKSAVLAPGTTQAIELTLQNVVRGGRVRGLVRSASGELAGPGIQVDVTGGTLAAPLILQTGADSYYEFPPELAIGYYTIVARHPTSGERARVNVYLPAGQDLDQPITLLGRGQVVVTVVDGAGDPVDSARVKLTESGYPNLTYETEVLPGAAGQAVFDQVFQGDFSVSAVDQYARGGRVSGILPGPGAEIALTLRLTVTGTVRGRFSLPGSDAGVPYGTVRLLASNRVIGQVTTAGTGEVGSFLFDYVPAGPIRVEAEDPKTGRTGTAQGTLSVQDEVVDLDVRAQALGTVQGLVTQNGNPQAATPVTVQVSPSFNLTTATDGVGRYVLNGVPAGDVRVAASRDGGFLRGTGSAQLVNEGQVVEVDVALLDTGAVRGQVIPARPTDSVLSQVTILAGGAQISTSTDAEGRFAFEEVPAGTAHLRVQQLNGIDQASVPPFEVPARGDIVVNPALNGVGGIAGTARDSLGAPTAGWLQVSGTGPFPYGRTVAIGPDGEIRLPELLAGPFSARLQVGAGAATLYGNATGQVVPGETFALDIRVQDSGTVKGIVMGAGGLPVGGATVTLRLEPYRGELSAISRSDGNFTFSGLPLGPFSVRVRNLTSTGYALVTDRTININGEVIDLGQVVLDETAIEFVSVTPAPGSSEVAVETPVTLVFSDVLATSPNIVVRRGTTVVSRAAQIQPDGRTAVLLGSFASKWPDGADLEIAVIDVRDIHGRSVTPGVVGTFRTVDLSGPTVTATSPAANAIQVPVDTIVEATFNEALASDAHQRATFTVQPVAGGPSVQGSVVLASADTLSFEPASPLAANTRYRASVNGAVDATPRANPQTTAKTWDFATVDTVPPQITPTAPLAWTKDAKPSITGTLTDNLSGIKTSTLVVELLAGTPVTATASSLAYSATPNTPLAEGTHDYRVRVADIAGNVAQTEWLRFGVDTASPGPATLVTPVADATVAGHVAVSATATDPGVAGSGIGKIEVLHGTSVLATLLAPGFSGGFNSALLPDGARELSARATDVAGNVGPAGPLTRIIVDNHPLSVQITAPAANTVVGDSVTVKALVAETEPVERVEFTFGTPASAPFVDTTRPFEAVLNTSLAPEGPLFVRATAFGTYGGSITSSVTVTVDHTAPAAPSAGLVSAHASDLTRAVVIGLKSSVPGGVQVEASNPARNATTTAMAAGDGSFFLYVNGQQGDVINLVTIDTVGNRSQAVAVTVGPKLYEGAVPQVGLQLWLKADTGVVTDASGRVSTWQDQSPRAVRNHAVQTTATARPLLVSNAGGGVPALRFDGSDDSLTLSERIQNAATVFWVLRNTSTSNYRAPMGDTSDHIFLSNSNRKVWFAGNVAPVLGGQTWLNGNGVDGTETFYPPATDPMAVLSSIPKGVVPVLYVGSGLGYYWHGDIAEVLVYSVPLSAADRRGVEDYLAVKYAAFVPKAAAPRVSPNGGPFTTSTTVTMTTSTPGASIKYTIDGTDPTVSASARPYEAPFILDATTTVKAVTLAPGLPVSSVTTTTFIRSEDFSPISLSGLTLWFAADAGLSVDGAAVTKWADQSPRANDLLQSAPTKMPSVSTDTYSGRPVVQFDGSADQLDLTTPTTSLQTVFWVLRNTSPSGYRTLMGDSSDHIFLSDSDRRIWYGSNAVAVREGMTFLNGEGIDGQLVKYPAGTGRLAVLSVVANGPLPAKWLGAGLGYFWHGDIAEVVAYDRRLSGPERARVEEYLVRRHATTNVAPPPVAPAISPNGGAFADTVEVTLSTTTPGAQILYTLDGTPPTPSSETYVGPLLVSTTTTVKAVAYDPDLGLSTTTVTTFTRASDFSPRSLAGLGLWLRSDAGLTIDGATVTRWADQSGRANDAVRGVTQQSYKLPRVVTDTVSQMPAVTFDGTDDSLELSTRTVDLQTYFWVVRNTSTSGYRPPMGDSSDHVFLSDSNRKVYFGGLPATVLNGMTSMDGVAINGTGTFYPSNGRLSVLSVVATGAVPVKWVGTGQAYWWRGEIAEVVAYDRRLDGPERHRVEEYLMRKYATVVNLPPGAPTFTPNGGTFDAAVDVSIASSTPGVQIHFTDDGSEPTANSPVYEGPVRVEATRTLKAKAYDPVRQAWSRMSAVSFVKETDESPASFSGLRLWLRSDAGLSVDGSVVTGWLDQSGKGNNVRHASGQQSYKLPTVMVDLPSNMPAVHFDGGDDFLELTTRELNVQTVFWVLRNSSTSGYRAPMGDGSAHIFLSGDNRQIWYAGNPAAVTSGQTAINGMGALGTSFYPPGSDPLAILSLRAAGPVPATWVGTGQNYFWKGDFAEIVLYDRVLTPAEVTAVSKYLARKYKIQSPVLQ